MDRSGNIGAAKNMDSVFADFTEEELFQDLMFDEDDQLIEIVEGYTAEGNTIFEEDEEIFKIVHQITDDDKTPEQVKKDTENELGPDNRNDQNIKDIEDVKKTELDDSQTFDNLKKNGESDADKVLGLDKIEDEYHATADASVKESQIADEVFEKWLNEEAYDTKAEDEAEGSDTKFGNKDLDNTAVSTDNIKPEGDKEYNATNTAAVKEEAYDTKAEDEAEGSDTKFGNKDLDNTAVKPDEVAPNGDENYNDTSDASVKEEPFDEAAFERWLTLNEEDEVKEAECACGKPDCPICSKKAELAPTAAPIEDKTNGERNEESNNNTITTADGEGIAPGKVDDNSFPAPENMTPEGSPEVDNGNIADDSEKQDSKACEGGECKAETEEVDEAAELEKMFEAFLNEADIEEPVLEPNETITPAEVEKAEDELEKAAPETGKEIKESTDEPKAEGTQDNSPAPDPTTDGGATSASDEACGKGSCVKEETEVNDKPDPNETEELPTTGTAEAESNVDEAAELEKMFEAFLNEADEVEAPTATDVEAAAKTEVEDTETELDDDLAAVANADGGAEPAGLEYDPSDEDLIDLAGGVDESAK